MTNEVLISWADQDFVIVNGTPTMDATVSTAQRLNGILNTNAATDALNDEIKYNRWFDKSGTYKVRLLYSKGANGAITDIAIDSPAGNNLFDGVTVNGSGTNLTVETTKEIARGFHDLSFLVEADGGTSDFQLRIIALFFDLIDEHPVLGESAPAKEADGMVLLAKHTAEVVESTFTFDLADIDLSKNGKYVEVIVKVEGKATASLALQVDINAAGGTNYQIHGTRSTTSADTHIDLITQAQIQLLSTTIIPSTQNFMAELTMKVNPDDILFGIFRGEVYDQGIERGVWGRLLSAAKVTSIEIKTSASTWRIGTTIEVYGVKK